MIVKGRWRQVESSWAVNIQAQLAQVSKLKPVPKKYDMEVKLNKVRRWKNRNKKRKTNKLEDHY